MLTNAALVEGPQGLLSQHTTVRREILASAAALQVRGIAVHIVSLKLWPGDQVAAIVAKADFAIFGSMLDASFEGAYREAIRGMQGKRAVFITGLGATRFYDEVSPITHAFVARPPVDPATTASRTYVYPVPSEAERAPPHAVRRGLRRRAATAIAKRYGVGLDPWRLRLLWVGTSAQAAAVVDSLPELRNFAAKVPLALECLTEAGSPLEQHVTPPVAGAAAPLRVSVGQRAIETVAAALKDCDVVVYPDAEIFVDALQAGRFTVGGTPPSEALAGVALSGASLTDRLRWFLRNPSQVVRHLEQGQAYVARHHSLAALGGFWMEVLGFAAVREAAILVQQSRERRMSGDGAGAERMLTRALELDGSSAEAHHLLGNVMQDRGTLDRAISCYRRALRLDPQMAAAHNDIATAYVAKGWREEAIESYSEAIRLDPNSPTAHSNLAQLLLKLGRRRDALPHVRAAVRWRLAHLVRRTL